ncbi:3-oxoacyl-[acyl-carrier protein] reductase [Paenibacillus phyllosphaerae]|uniref:3-oxoacyl-[acyl-carrier protein] reductase n=1 Tax=Paenibacillus phyllosphaerae TaxID=274593 RepID=A0A7W5AU77_9BACL|nr:SDR family NAD(P)-dependent oxidoreductase [Paenibacillus phyllosphaerae]MBB3108757.1 3-oxoacyl-[acyl-carrier protein] reductase [Paenibacillus phyllosphaerae]
MTEQQQQIVLINGAGCEVGRAAAKMFAMEDAIVILCDQESETLQEITNEIFRAGKQATIFFTDVTQPLEVSAMVQQVIEEYGVIDVLVNNTTNHVRRAEKERAFEYYTQFFEDLVTSVSLVTASVLPYMRERKSGRVVHIMPGVIHVGENGFPAYAVAQSSLHKMTQVAAASEREHGILINILNPGAIRTELNPFYGEEPETILPMLGKLASLPAGSSSGMLFNVNIMDHLGQIYLENLFDDEEVAYMDDPDGALDMEEGMKR